MRRKRIWGMILAVCMLVQPISVLAEEKEQNGYLNIREYATGEKTQIYVKARSFMHSRKKSHRSVGQL